MRSHLRTRIACTVDLERPLFGQFLRQIVGLRSEQLIAGLEQQVRSGGRLGAIFRSQGLLSREQLMDVFRAQARWVALTMQADLQADPFPWPAFLSLCLPAYNERANIEDTLDAACAILPAFVQRFEIVVVDDGSQDGTGDVVAGYAEQEPRVRLVRHPHNQGYGAAVATALRAARGELLMFTDSDGQFSLLDLPQLLVRLGERHVVIGYRYQRADHWMRRFNAWGWTRLIRYFLGVRVRDLDCAFKLFRREVVERIHLTSRGAAINAEIMVQCVRGGLEICETPVSHYPRYSGAPTGAALRVIWRAFRELPGLWRYRTEVPLFQADAAPDRPVSATLASHGIEGQA